MRAVLRQNSQKKKGRRGTASTALASRDTHVKKKKRKDRTRINNPKILEPDSFLYIKHSHTQTSNRPARFLFLWGLSVSSSKIEQTSRCGSFRWPVLVICCCWPFFPPITPNKKDIFITSSLFIYHFVPYRSTKIQKKPQNMKLVWRWEFSLRLWFLGYRFQNLHFLRVLHNKDILSTHDRYKISSWSRLLPRRPLPPRTLPTLRNSTQKHPLHQHC